MATATQTVTQNESVHTNAEYRFKVMEVKKNFYVVKMVNVVKNNGDRKTLHIPRRDLYVKKDLVSDKLSQYDYINLKFTYVNRRYNVTDVLSFDKVQRTSSEQKQTKVTKNDDVKVQKTNPNPFAALAWSDSEED